MVEGISTSDGPRGRGKGVEPGGRVKPKLNAKRKIVW
jgi:hypothetical protein